MLQLESFDAKLASALDDVSFYQKRYKFMVTKDVLDNLKKRLKDVSATYRKYCDPLWDDYISSLEKSVCEQGGHFRRLYAEADMVPKKWMPNTVKASMTRLFRPVVNPDVVICCYTYGTNLYWQSLTGEAK